MLTRPTKAFHQFSVQCDLTGSRMTQDQIFELALPSCTSRLDLLGHALVTNDVRHSSNRSRLLYLALSRRSPSRCWSWPGSSRRNWIISAVNCDKGFSQIRLRARPHRKVVRLGRQFLIRIGSRPRFNRRRRYSNWARVCESGSSPGFFVVRNCDTARFTSPATDAVIDSETEFHRADWGTPLSRRHFGRFRASICASHHQRHPKTLDREDLTNKCRHTSHFCSSLR
jgi:hypothetical protein